MSAMALSSNIPSSTSRCHQLDKENSRGSISLHGALAIPTTPSQEYRNGYRLQRKAYEGRSQTPTLASIINNRSPKNVYVDRLKEFYYLDEGNGERDHDNGESKRFGGSVLARRTAMGHKDAPEIKSILRSPETKIGRSAKTKNTVKLVLPSDSPTALGNNSGQGYVRGYRTKIPPPVPFLLPSFQTRKEEMEDDLSSSLSSNVASSILAAVNELKKTPSNSTRRPQRSHQYHRRKRQYNSNMRTDPNTLAMKMSLPCRIGCCYCVYSSILGPVKVFMTRSQRPKQGPWVAGIRDGYGRLVIPVSRKSDVTGLVYDAHSHSLHPPAKGERPMFPSATGVLHRERTGVKEHKRTRTNTSNKKEVNKHP